MLKRTNDVRLVAGSRVSGGRRTTGVAEQTQGLPMSYPGLHNNHYAKLWLYKQAGLCTERSTPRRTKDDVSIY